MNALSQRVLRSSPFYYGWVVVAVAAASNIARVASAVEVSTLFIPALSAEFGWSLTAIASATTIGSIGSAATGPLVGGLLDRFGPRIVAAAGGALVGGACFALAGARSLAVYIVAYAIVRYAGQGLVLFSTPIVVANWFERRRGTAVALLFGASAFGLMAAPIGVQFAIEVAGWRFAWVVLGLVAAGLGVFPALLFLERRPEDLGLVPDGVPANDSGSSSSVELASPWTALAAMHTPSLWLLMGSTFFVSVVTTGVGFHQMPFYLSRGIDATTGAAVVSIFAMGLAVGSVLSGWLADRVSPRWLTVGQNLALALVMVAVLGVNGAPQAFAFAFAFGTLVGGYMTLPTILVADYYGRSSLGAISGVVHVVRGVGLALGPTVAGVFFDITGHYDSAFVTFGGMAVVATVLMAMASRPRQSPRCAYPCKTTVMARSPRAGDNSN